jgi:formylglycine-generating enzyme required for sulfatase activity
VGNYRDETFREKFPDDGDPQKPYLRTIINGYRDGFVTTAPVGSFPPNPFGLFDLGGNVSEWVGDLYEPGSEDRVARDASWLFPNRDYCLSSWRHHAVPNRPPTNAAHGDVHGFRLVLGEAVAANATGSPALAPPPSAKPASLNAEANGPKPPPQESAAK